MNPQDNCESKEQTASLADLLLNTELEEETKAGGRISPFPGFSGGVVVAAGDVG